MFDSMVFLSSVLIIVLLTTFIRAAFGFGNALIAMPMLIPLLGVRAATPLVGLIGLVIAVLMLLGEWGNIDLQDAWRLILATIVGIPIGLIFLTKAPELYVRMILGGILAIFGLYNLIGPPLPKIRRPRLALVFGLIGGILGGAYNSNGPPVVIYGAMRDWSPHKFRATLQGYFFVTSIAIVVGHGVSGLWKQEVLILFLLSLPATMLAVWGGQKIAHLIPEQRFDRYVHLLLIILGGFLFF